MAGFQDQLIGPAPYVETLPVDAYTRVGMLKQRAYDEGVQKVQGYIDNIAGIEALMPEQKDYLDQKIGQLKSQVSTIASQDFSNEQITNSVGHLTQKIASDPIVQNTVYATNAYRAESAKMKQAQDTGKSSPVNEYIFQRGVHNWLASGDPSKSFDASYTPYRDVNSKLLKAINQQSGLKPDEWLTEMPFKRGENGKVLVDQTGAPILDINTLIEKYKGVSAEKLKNIIDTTLDEGDRQQLSFDGQYQYRGADKNAMKEVTDSSYSSIINQIGDTIQGLKVKRETSTDDPEALKQIDAEISRQEQRAKDYKTSYTNDIQGIDNNLEGYKGSLHTQNYLSKFAEGWSYAEHSLTYGDNPGFKNAMAEQDMKRKWDQFSLTYGLDREKFGLEKDKFEFEKAKAAGTAGGAAGNLSTREPIDNPDVTTTLNKFADDVNTQLDQANLLDMALLATKNPELVERKFDKKGNAYFAWKGDTKEQRDKNTLAGQSAINSYLTSNGNGDIDIETWKANTQGLRSNYQAGMKVVSDAQAQADKDPELNLDTRLKAVPTLSFKGVDGSQHTMDAKKILNFNKKATGVYKQANTDINLGLGSGLGWLESLLSNTATSQSEENLANRTFTDPDEKAMWGAIQRYKKGYPNVSPEDEKIVNRIYAVEKLGRDVADKREGFTANVLKNVLPVFQPVSTPLEQFKGEDKKKANAWATNQFVGLNADKLTGLNYDKKDVQKMLGKDHIDNTNIFIVDRGEGKLSMRLENVDVIGGKKMEIDLPQANVEALLGGKFGVDTFKQIRNMQRYSSLSDGAITTNVLRQGANTATPLKNGNIQGYKVKYDVEQLSNGGGNQIRLYVYDPATKTNKSVVLNPGIAMSESQVIAALQHISNDTIKTALKDQPAE